MSPLRSTDAPTPLRSYRRNNLSYQGEKLPVPPHRRRNADHLRRTDKVHRFATPTVHIMPARALMWKGSQLAYTRIVENLVLTSTLRLEGPEWDNTLVRNVTIKDVKGDGLMLRNVSNVRIENVTIENVSGTGIKLSKTGSTRNVEIVDSTINGTGRDGINSGEATGVDHVGLKIIGNTISNTGLDGGSSGLLHGIYLQSSEFLVEDNILINSHDGNAISVRSSGIVRGNHIDGAYKSGIAYYADHPAGASNKLVIEDNVVVDAGKGGARGDINLLNLPGGSDPVDTIIVRNNTLSGEKGVVIDADYAAKKIATTSTGNVTVSEAEARRIMDQDDQGPAGASPPETVRPSEPSQPDVPNQPDDVQEGRVGLSLSGVGTRTKVEMTRDDVLAETVSAARQKIAAANLDEIDVRITATKNGAAASLGIDSGRLGVASAGETSADASQILGSESMVFDFSKQPGEVVDVTIDLLLQGTAVVTGYRDGVAIGTQTVRGTSVSFSDDEGFDRLVLSAGTSKTGISVTGFEAEYRYDDSYLI
uniref:Right handed beta helix domain-containing protein n=1 Tax=Cereibacter sphaeroides (strain ATCC 17025 / ATH 2.4.3) TaxID=349102 RepID=A4WY19_CERS5